MVQAKRCFQVLVVPAAHDQPGNAVRISRLSPGDFLLPNAYSVGNVREQLQALMSAAVKDNCLSRAQDLAGGQSLEQAESLIEVRFTSR